MCTWYFIAGRSNAALLFWLFGGFRCGVCLSFAIRVRYKILTQRAERGNGKLP